LRVSSTPSVKALKTKPAATGRESTSPALIEASARVSRVPAVESRAMRLLAKTRKGTGALRAKAAG